MTVRSLLEAFQSRFHAEPRIFRAPGRVNLIGDHTDYNAGLVLPAAIDLATYVAVGRRDDRQIVVESLDLGKSFQFSLDPLAATPCSEWSDYVQGVAIQLVQHGVPLFGANLMVQSEVPLGAGLSSSAALEVGVALALAAMAERRLPPLEVALLCQRAENEFVGAGCGLMDQFTACFGQAGQAILLDCHSNEHRLIPLGEDVRLVVANTMIRHSLAQGEYNQRRQECESAARHLGIVTLRDISPPDLERNADKLPIKLYKRTRHVVTENARVLAAAEALHGGYLATFGALMRASHDSLRDDFEVSCAELDSMVSLASELPGVYGTRMTGGGFGGSTISLVDASEVEQFAAELRYRYHLAHAIDPAIYICRPVNGAGEAS